MYVDFLNLVTTIAIGLAALASLITIFKSGDKFNQGDLLDFRGIVLSSILICLGATLPIFLSTIISNTAVWIYSSLIFSIVVATLQIQLEHNIHSGQYIVWSKLSLPLRLVTLLVNAVVFANIFFWQSAEPFLMGIFWVLIATSLRLYIFLISVTNKYTLPEAHSKNDTDKHSG